jgi:hypothetical protein
MACDKSPDRAHVSGRAETDEEKRAILGHIYEAWIKVPTARLGQVIVARVPGVYPNASLFYIEDERLASEIEDDATLTEKLIGGR